MLAQDVTKYIKENPFINRKSILQLENALKLKYGVKGDS